MRLFSYLEEMANKGRVSLDFTMEKDQVSRRGFDTNIEKGRDFIFSIRENFTDSMFINTFIDQDFVDRHKLFVAGKRLNKERMTWQYYVKSRKAEEYKKMVLDSLYHPPFIRVKVNDDNSLHLDHLFEGRPLVQDYLKGVLLGIEYLWGGQVFLDTSEVVSPSPASQHENPDNQPQTPQEITWQRVRYRMKNRRLSRKVLTE
jgi:stage V sporulation protein R